MIARAYTAGDSDDGDKSEEPPSTLFRVERDERSVPRTSEALFPLRRRVSVDIDHEPGDDVVVDVLLDLTPSHLLAFVTGAAWVDLNRRCDLVLQPAHIRQAKIKALEQC